MRAACLAVVLAWAVPAAAAVSEEAAGKMMKDTVDQALVILRDPGLQGLENRGKRWSKLRALSDTVFDWAAMAQRSLGVHWRSLDDGQRKRFVDVFKELIAANYLGQIDAFQGEEKLNFVGNESTSKGEVWVNMELITQSRQKVPIAFLVADANKVKDVKIEQISITSHYRDSLNRIFVNGGFDAAMKKLEAKAAANRRLAEKAAE
ncbi:MAG: ABC transporter substrate-binding protein [Myxococcota bacterium]